MDHPVRTLLNELFPELFVWLLQRSLGRNKGSL
jgi:hypothetical protein